MEAVTSEPQSIMVKLLGGVRSLQFGCGDCPNLVCKGSVAAFKGTASGFTASVIVRGREENTIALVASWGALCLHTAPTETYFPSKGRNFGNTSSSPPDPLLVTSYLYFVQAYIISCACLCPCCCACHIGSPTSCIPRQPILLLDLI